MAGMPENSVDAIVTDPPYELGFMGRAWDATGIAFSKDTWALAMRVLKPGGHLVAFAATKNSHRMVCAIEDAGFEIRDSLAWVYGSGFPKSLDVSKAIDKAAGAERAKVRIEASTLGNPPNLVGGAVKGDDRPWRLAALERGYHEVDGDEPATDAAKQWQGWGTALKPAFEPICLARKPLSERTVAANVLRWGTGAINVDACRVEGGERQTQTGGMGRKANPVYGAFENKTTEALTTTLGRWPANLCHDGSQEVLDVFPESKGQQGDVRGDEPSKPMWGNAAHTTPFAKRNDTGSAARFFYHAKASRADRNGSKHPTVKPISLMQWLVRMVAPKGSVILDPFGGSGTTGEAARREGVSAILIEREPEYAADIQRRFSVAV